MVVSLLPTAAQVSRRHLPDGLEELEVLEEERLVEERRRFGEDGEKMVFFLGWRTGAGRLYFRFD